MVRLHNLSERLRFSRLQPYAAALVLALGVAARLAQYLANRSLWLDEAYLALNILERDFAGLTQPLANNQVAPVGFLWAVKALTLAFGSHEGALRLLPLAGGILSVPLAYYVARRSLGRGSALLVAALLGWAQPLVYYASELKPYTTDAFVALVALALYLPWYERPEPPSWGRSFVSGLVGALLLWFSYPFAFVLAALGTGLALHALLRRDAQRLLRLVPLALLWGASFGLLYAIALRYNAANAFLRDFWRDFFAPLPPERVTDLFWFPQKWFDFLVYAAGLPFYGLATFAWLNGGVALGRRRRWAKGAALVLPLVFAILASALRLYPFYVRTILFAVPPTVLLIAYGVRALYRALKTRQRWMALLAMAMLLFHPFYRSVLVLALPMTNEEVRPALAYVAEHRQPGDHIYVYHGAAPVFRYYAPRFGLDDEGLYTIGEASNGDFAVLAERVRSLEEGRVWFLFAHVYTFEGISEEAYVLELLEARGTRVDLFRSPGAAVYLYELGP
jgi:hypothetical protein